MDFALECHPKGMLHVFGDPLAIINDYQGLSGPGAHISQAFSFPSGLFYQPGSRDLKLVVSLGIIGDIGVFNTDAVEYGFIDQGIFKETARISELYRIR